MCRIGSLYPSGGGKISPWDGSIFLIVDIRPFFVSSQLYRTALSKEDKLEKKDEVVEIARQVVPQPVLNNPTKENLLNLEGDTDLGSFKQSIHL